ncbi:Hypothetical predicted protein [Mytilus galloprovincialis]|uniref:Uncharacterized protein n=1 Tax=Mytilus galloprovincialis TaxID=29158 RepID=A0A8B6FNC4_MYTGA|nr:Hypothetical predicted protein [Mytilus galloprovincialis]
MVQPPFCSTPNMVHPPRNSSPSMMSQRPVWVDELFTNMRHIETRLDKHDQIGILVSSMNMKVIQVEQETKSLSERLAAVEISTQYVSDQYEDQKTKCNELKSSVINIEKTIKTQHSDVSSVEKKMTAQKKEIEQSFEKMKNLNEKMREDLLDTQIKSNIENLVFYNIPEKDDEDCLEESLIFCEKNLKMPNMRESIQILKANRMGNKGERIRPILVKFGSFKQREEVRKNGKNLKDTNFGISEQLPDSSYLSIVNPSLQYAQQMQSFQPFQQTPHQQMVQPPFCSTPNMVHPPPNSSPSMMSQRPVWVDELFTNMRHIETRLDKLDQIGILVSSMKVIQETKSLSERLAAVEISTQYVSDQYEDQKTKCNELKSSVINIEKTINTQHSDVSSVEKKMTAQKKEIEQSFEKMKNLNEKMREDLLDTQIKSNIENLVFYNIPEKDDEDCLEESLIFCEKNLKMPNMILKANRMGNKGDPILVKFGSFNKEVRKNSKNLKDTNFGISEQLPGEIQKRRKTLLPELKKLRDEGHKAYFVRDKIHVGGKEYKK